MDIPLYHTTACTILFSIDNVREAKSMPIVAFVLNVNSFFVKRETNCDFPTALFPRTTTTQNGTSIIQELTAQRYCELEGRLCVRPLISITLEQMAWRDADDRRNRGRYRASDTYS